MATCVVLGAPVFDVAAAERGRGISTVELEVGSEGVLTVSILGRAAGFGLGVFKVSRMSCFLVSLAGFVKGLLKVGLASTFGLAADFFISLSELSESDPLLLVDPDDELLELPDVLLLSDRRELFASFDAPSFLLDFLDLDFG